jgi:hypothetical protein
VTFFLDKHGIPKYESNANVKSFVLIPIPVDRAFEAPAIEEYLISKLNPPKNASGRTN